MNAETLCGGREKLHAVADALPDAQVALAVEFLRFLISRAEVEPE